MKARKQSKKNKEGQEQKSGTAVKPLEDLNDLQHEELSGVQDERSSLAVSSTDEDEDEGLGDGNIGRSKNNILGK